MRTFVLSIYWLARLQLWIGAVCAVCMCGFVFASAVMRYFLRSPWATTEEIVGLLFYTSCLMVLPATTLAGKQIRLNFLDKVVSERGQQLISIIAGFALVAMLAGLIIFSLENAFFTRSINARSEIARLNLFPWMLVAPFCLSTMAATVLLRWMPAFNSLPPLVAGLDSEEEEIL